MLSTLVEKGVILLQKMLENSFAQNENKNTSSIVITMNNQPHFAFVSRPSNVSKKGKLKNKNKIN